jgi:hypothetical protein
MQEIHPSSSLLVNKARIAMKRIIRTALLAGAATASAFAFVAAGAPSASADDYGPDTCLAGYV